MSATRKRTDPRSLAIEAAATRRYPLGMPPARFLRDYWQKRPLLIRAAFPQFHNCIAPNDLAGLACEDTALARIVLRDARRDRWTLRNGPFSERDFARLPKSHWTLLVQDVDKWDADVAAVLEPFAFLPSWRIDDVMVSYAEDGGGVGPHVDNYDVFLIQAAGTRRWRISTDPSSTGEFRDDVELKLLKQFTPTHEWTLETGDALYLPPGFAHDGVAVGQCMTLSVGMRAPAVAELVIDLAESVAEPLGEDQRYIDPDLAPARDANQIDRAAMHRVRAALARFMDCDDEALSEWFGRFITRYRSAHEAAPGARPISASQLTKKLGEGKLLRNPWSRVAWSRHGRRAKLFVAGEHHVCSLRLARLLTGQQRKSTGNWSDLAADEIELLARLVNDGHFIVSTVR